MASAANKTTNSMESMASLALRSWLGSGLMDDVVTLMKCG